MKKLLAKKYKDRDTLDKEVGLISDKTGITIEGTVLELKRLHLSHRKKVYGVPVVATNFVKNDIKQTEINRGKVHSFGIDGNLKKPPLKVKKKKK